MGVVIALSPYNKSMGALKYGLWAIGNLATGHAANRAELGKRGACFGECMVSLAWLYFSAE